jgi:hypothetical protein
MVPVNVDTSKGSLLIPGDSNWPAWKASLLGIAVAAVFAGVEAALILTLEVSFIRFRYAELTGPTTLADIRQRKRDPDNSHGNNSCDSSRCRASPTVRRAVEAERESNRDQLGLPRHGLVRRLLLTHGSR